MRRLLRYWPEWGRIQEPLNQVMIHRFFDGGWHSAIDFLES
jgi:hypothetical protein